MSAQTYTQPASIGSAIGLEELFFQRKQKLAETATCPDEEYDFVYDQLSEIEGRILEADPKTMQDLAIQILVMTDDGEAIGYENAENCKLIKTCRKLARV